MMCAEDLGNPLDRWDLTLNKGGGYHKTLDLLGSDGGGWEPPLGSAVELVFGDPAAPIELWAGVLDGERVTFSRTAAQIAAARTALPAGTAVRLRVTFPPDTEPEVWSVGAVMWQ
ncbi:MAG: hypothetical protein QM658_09665 [Gordonia sp. (in: high G+C Gram-positive bacteria)]